MNLAEALDDERGTREGNVEGETCVNPLVDACSVPLESARDPMPR